MGARKDLANKRYGNLTAIEFAGTDKHNKAIWKVYCDCGGVASVLAANLLSGTTKSCGCIKLRHGHCAAGVQSREYNSWNAMMNRCYNSLYCDYSYYGGRGITVWEVWHMFEGFYAWMGDRPEGKTLDRLNNDIGYNPFNCRWATAAEQALNRRPWKWNGIK